MRVFDNNNNNNINDIIAIIVIIIKNYLRFLIKVSITFSFCSKFNHIIIVTQVICVIT